MATWPTTAPKATITTAITAPAITRDCRDRAPAALFSADADTDPPTGMPWNTPAATFAAPCPVKSRDTSGKPPSGLGKLAEMLAPWTSPTNARDSAGTSSDGTAASSGSSGRGRDWGTSPRSARVATSCQPNRAAAAEVRMTATTSPIGPSLVRSSSTINAMVAAPTTRVCRCS